MEHHLKITGPFHPFSFTEQEKDPETLSDLPKMIQWYG